MMDVRITRQPTGLTVVTDRMEGVKTAAIGVYVGAGSRHEHDDEHGLSHFLEHMAFKGTRRRSARRIAEEIEAVGGYLNAQTGTEQTAYYARVLAQDVPLALDLLADILTDSVLDPLEMAREKNVVVQEIGAVEDTPDDLVFDLFNATAFPGQPLGRPILGTVETVERFEPEAIRAYLARTYRAPRMVLVAAGAVDDAAVTASAERLFAGLGSHIPAAPRPAAYRGGTQLMARDLEQSHVILGLPGLGVLDPDVHAARIFASILGGGMSSRLFQEVREVRGLAYAIQAFHWSHQDSGLMGVYAGTAPDDVEELLTVVRGEWERAAGDIASDELHRAKTQLKASVLMALESSAARAEMLGHQLLTHGRAIPPEEIEARIESVTLEDLRRVGARVLDGPATLVAIGPADGLPERAAAA